MGVGDLAFGLIGDEFGVDGPAKDANRLLIQKGSAGLCVIHIPSHSVRVILVSLPMSGYYLLVTAWALVSPFQVCASRCPYALKI